MRAWTLVKSVNGWFRQPLVIRVRGGKAGGGARLSETGCSVVALYRRMEKETETAIRQTWKELRRLLPS